MNWVYYFRIFDCILAGLVSGFCFLRVGWDKENTVRNARVAGLGLLTIAIAWGSFARRYDIYRPWLPFVTAGLLLCVYGMRRQAVGEKAR